MVAKLFRREQPINETLAIEPEPLESPESREKPEHRETLKISKCEERLAGYEKQLAYLSEQKELHTLALKEMYQFLIKLDTSVRDENNKLRALIKIEHERSEKLIEVTKGLWEIVELMDDNREEASRLIDLTRDVEELARFDVEITDESENSMLDLPGIESLSPLMMQALTS